MKRVTTTLIFATMLLVPTTGTAQVADHVSFSLGFGLGGGTGFGISLHHDEYYYDDYRFGLHGPLWTRPLHCWDSFWYDPFQPCHGYFAAGFPVYDYWGWYNPWRFGFVGWPSPRYMRTHWWRAPVWSHYYSPFRHDDYAWGFGGWGWRGYDGWDWYSPSYTGYYDHGGGHNRVVRRSPLYGPRYKEYPTPPVYVTDNGPERPVSRAVPRSPGSGSHVGPVDPDRDLDRRGARLTDARRTARPRSGTGIRTARPSTGADTRTSPPRVRAAPRPSTRSTPSRRPQPSVGRVSAPTVKGRPQPSTRTRIEPTKRSAPRVRSTPSSRRPSPVVRPAPPSRRPPPTARPAPSRRSSPTVRSAPSRRPAPAMRSAPSRGSRGGVRSAPSRAPKPKVRSAPSRAPKPQARPAPRGSSSRKAPPRRPARRPGA